MRVDQHKEGRRHQHTAESEPDKLLQGAIHNFRQPGNTKDSWAPKKKHCEPIVLRSLRSTEAFAIN